MREFDVVPLLADVYPGRTMENPIAVICGEEDTSWSLRVVWDPTLTKPFRADHTSSTYASEGSVVLALTIVK